MRLLPWILSGVVGVIGVIGVSSCGKKEDTKKDDAKNNAPVAQPKTQCADAPGWRYEGIKLPPEFAPTMPAGQEKLFFAPGMFKPPAPTYFTYVFSLVFDRSTIWTAESVRSLLNTYYRGLMSAVATGKKKPLTPAAIAAIDSKVDPTKRGFRAKVSLVDTFTTGKPLDLHMKIEATGSCLRVAASPQPLHDSIWAQLDRALACVPCPPGD